MREHKGRKKLLTMTECAFRCQQASFSGDVILLCFPRYFWTISLAFATFCFVCGSISISSVSIKQLTKKTTIFTRSVTQSLNQHCFAFRCWFLCWYAIKNQRKRKMSCCYMGPCETTGWCEYLPKIVKIWGWIATEFHFPFYPPFYIAHLNPTLP